MKRVVAVFLGAVLLVVSLNGYCAGAVVLGLYNTGVDDSGVPVSDVAMDLHYSLTEVPLGSGLGPNSYVVDSSKSPLLLSWMPNSSTSKWIAPVADQSDFPNDSGAGYYAYRTQFDLTGVDLSTVVVNGQWSTDNYGSDILINGQSTGFTHTDSGGICYTYFSSFTIDSGFVDGINTLDFRVWNKPLYPGSINPTGLRVEVSGTGEPVGAVPEPASLAIWGMVLAGLCLPALRRRR